MSKQQFTDLVTSWLKTFVAAFIGFVLATGIGILSMSASDWKAALSAAIGATLVVVYNWLSPADPRYGVGS